MTLNNKTRKTLILLSTIIASGCEQDNQVPSVTVTPVTEQIPVITMTESSPSVRIETNNQFTIDNKRYLYNISRHSLEDLKSLLQRAEEITQAETKPLDDLEIVMILHGPDINLFTLDNYEDNKELIDLAKRLDAFDIIDLKVCETSMADLEIDRKQIPLFIESVPYAPDEIKRLSQEGYIDL